jgi:hypothetical protein
MVNFFSIIYNNIKMEEIEEIEAARVGGVPPPIVEVKQPKITAHKSPGENNEGAYIWHLVLLRNIRNNYLNLTDKYLLPDYPITAEKREIIIVYRQMLRNIINLKRNDVLNGITDVEIPPIPI